MPDLLLIVNPRSANGSTGRRWPAIEGKLRTLLPPFDVAFSERPLHATAIAREAAGRYGCIALVGGDGTVNEVVNGLAGSQVPMALLPAGTANILAKELRIPWDIPRAARLIPGGVVRRIALGMVLPLNGRGSVGLSPEGRYFLCVGGAGPDGAIVNGVHEGLKKRVGVLAYWAEGVKQLFSYGFPEIRIRSNGRERKATILVAGRTVHYGGPFKITTGASLFEDRFEFLTNSRRSRLAYLGCLPALWLGKLRAKEGIETWKGTEAICEAAGSEPVYAQVDGEPAGRLPLVFRIVPDALSLVTPAAQ